MDYIEKIVIGLSGIVLSIFVSVALQMFGVDDPIIGHLSLAAIPLWLFLCVVYATLKTTKSTTKRMLWTVVPAIFLSWGTLHVDTWFMQKRAARGRLPTVAELAEGVVQGIKKEFPWLGQPTTTVAHGKQVPINPCAGKGFLSAYKNVCDGQVGQWVIDEATKIREMAENATQQASNDVAAKRSPDAVRFFFSNDFRQCCADDMKDLRTETLRRLGPSAKDAEELSRWDRLFPTVQLPWRTRIERTDPWNVKEYAPYLKTLGVKLKRKDIPRSAPYSLRFSEVQTKPQTPLTLPRAAIAMADQFDTSPLLPYRAIVTVTANTEIKNGYIVVEFNNKYGAAACDLPGADLALTMNRALMDNTALFDYLQDHRSIAYAVELGSLPLTPQRPMNIEVHSRSAVRVTKVTHFDE